MTKRTLPYGRQQINQDDIAAVVSVLESDWLTQGPKVTEFEQSVAQSVGVTYAVAANSATSALHIACLALGVSTGSRVWVPAISFVASANCARYCGATVDFIDVDAQTGNLCVDALSEQLSQAQNKHCLPDVVIVVHLGGHSCQMPRLHELATTYGFRIIEDASHALGGSGWDQSIGNCYYSDITVFSFHPVKIATSAEGGMATTECEQLAHRMRLYANHGIEKNPKFFSQPSDGEWYYEQQCLGFNYRLSDLHAALGISQLGRLNWFVEQRNEWAIRYSQALACLPVTLVQPLKDTYSSWHLAMILCESAELKHRLFDVLRQHGIGAQVHYIPIHLQPYYQQLGFSPGYCPNAERFYQRVLSLPLYPGLTEDDFAYVMQQLQRGLDACA